MLSVFRTPRKPLVRVEKRVTIKTDMGGQRHEYHSLEEVPPEVRKELEELASQPWKTISQSSSSDGRVIKTTSGKTLSTYKFTDEAGNEHIYHSLEEMPPELRTAVEQAMRNEDSIGDDKEARE